MAKFLREMQTFSNVAASAVATSTLAVTKRYHSVHLEIRHDTSADGGAANTLMTQTLMANHIEEIRLRVTSAALGTITLWEIKGVDLQECINDHYGVPAVDGVLSLVFAAPYWNNPAVEDFFALGTADLQSVQIEVKFDSTVVSPVMVGYALEYAGANQPLGKFIKLAHITLSNSATGILEEPDLPVIGNGIGLKAIHLSTNAVSDVEFRADGTVIYEDLPTLRDVIADLRSLRTGGRSQNANYTHLDFAGNNIADVFDMTGVRDFRAKLNRTGTGSFRALTETVIG